MVFFISVVYAILQSMVQRVWASLYTPRAIPSSR